MPTAPRTSGERRAYIAGYTDAIFDIYAKGVQSAIEWLRTMAEDEGMINAEQSRKKDC